MTATLPPEELRSLVREVLRDVLPTVMDARPPEPVPAPVAPAVVAPPAVPGPVPALPDEPPQDGESVVLATDADLEAFVRRLVGLFENPRHRQDLRHGRLRFRLAAGSASAPVTASRPVVRVERGALTERQVRDAARAGARIVLGRSAVITPLARDRARALGVDIDKER
jgi:hypothetical protein